MTIANPVANEPSWTVLVDRPETTYSRPLLGSELLCDQFAQFYDGLAEPVMGVTFTSMLPHDELEARTRKAFARLRFVSPVIAATLENVHDTHLRSFVYTATSDVSGIQLWARESLIVRHEAMDVEAFIASINQTKLPYVLSDGTQQILRAYLYLGPAEGGNKHAIFFHGSHTLMDARPTFAALSLLLEFMSDDALGPLEEWEWGSEWKALPAGPVTATGGPKEDYEGAGLALKNRAVETMTSKLASHSLDPQRQEAQVAGRPVRVRVIVPADTSSKLLKAAKGLGYTVTHLFEAAQALAIFAINPPSDEDKPEAHITWPQSIISLSKWQVPPHNTKAHFVGTLTLVPTKVRYVDVLWSESPKGRLLALMQHARAQYDFYLKNPHLPHFTAAMVTLNPPREPGISRNPFATTITNLGVVEQTIPTEWHIRGVTGTPGDGVPAITVQEMAFGHRLTQPNPLTHIWTMHSQMYVQVEASDHWDKDYLQKYVEEIVRQAELLVE
ncbi:hypothetical protein FA95DRAFT_691001 [Auriscalpium vulgare]|uniref:Uncharacterized protein n=1 Tax=Auriscalpium vulgare TaxID=40419 RepID=A0ACB8RBT9_9AGAM|nr:hypothetical protein FA95DRAFT_691001 [Auriscalpium vulgare]